MIIGRFITHTNGCLTGFIPFIKPDGAEISVTPVARDPNTEFQFVLAEYQNIELGRGQSRKTKTGETYIAVTLDAPYLPEPLHCKLVDKTGGRHELVWSRDNTNEHAERMLSFYAELDPYHPHRDNLARLLQTLLRHCDDTGQSFEDQLSRARYLDREQRHDFSEIPF
jgi:uncharacterized protein (DUF736 family)